MATDVSTSAPASVSRRRVLVGTAWATPAVVVGLAAPPAAASTPGQPGGLAVAPVSASRVVTNPFGFSNGIDYTVTAVVSFVGATTDLDVTNVRLRISIDADRVSPNTSISITSGSSVWSRPSSDATGLAGTGTTGQLRFFDFNYASHVGQGSAATSAQIEIKFSGGVTRWFDPEDTRVYFQAFGTSGSVPVESARVSDNSA